MAQFLQSQEWTEATTKEFMGSITRLLDSSDAKESSEVFDKLMKRAKNILEELESLAKCDYLDEEEKASAMDALKKRLQDVYKKISSIGEDNE